MPPRIEVVVGIVRDGDGRILANRRRPGSHLAGLWEFPGGKRLDGEDPQVALARELREELGIEVGIAKPLMTLSHTYPERRVHLDVWSVLDYAGSPSPLEGQVIAWIAPDDLAGLEFLPADAPIVAKLTSSR